MALIERTSSTHVPSLASTCTWKLTPFSCKLFHSLVVNTVLPAPNSTGVPRLSVGVFPSLYVSLITILALSIYTFIVILPSTLVFGAI